jgi:hypothetical protein
MTNTIQQSEAAEINLLCDEKMELWWFENHELNTNKVLLSGLPDMNEQEGFIDFFDNDSTY